MNIDLPGTGVTVHIRHTGAGLACLRCDTSCSGYETLERKWRHLDTFQYKTWLVAEVPRMKCPEHSVLQLPVPWAENNSRLTVLFEALVIDWLKIGTISEVAERLGLSWSAVMASRSTGSLLLTLAAGQRDMRGREGQRQQAFACSLSAIKPVKGNPSDLLGSCPPNVLRGLTHRAGEAFRPGSARSA